MPSFLTRFLFSLLLFVGMPVIVFGQTTKNGRVQTGVSASKPTTCSPGDQFNATDTSTVYVCGPMANTWGIISGVGIQVQTNGTNNTSQTALNFVTSTTNSCGTTLTPANPNSSQELVEATGTTNSGCGGTGIANPTVHGIYAAEGSSPFNIICTPPAVNGQYTLSYIVLASAAVDPTCPQNGIAARAITGATNTDTVLFGDNQSLIVHAQTASAAVTETLPTPTTLHNPAFVVSYVNASAQADTLKATTNTIQLGNGTAVAGATGVTIPTGAFVRISVDPSTANQWHVDCSGCTVGSSTATMTTGAIGSLACGTTVTVSAPGVATTDAIIWSFNAAPAANPGELVVSSWPTANNVNFQYCNPTAGSVTPNAATLNWRVVR